MGQVEGSEPVTPRLRRKLRSARRSSRPSRRFWYRFGWQGSHCAPLRVRLGNFRLSSARGLVRAPLMGSQGVHFLVERICYVVMRVHTAGVTGTGRSGTLWEANRWLSVCSLFLTSQEKKKLILLSCFESVFICFCQTAVAATNLISLLIPQF